MEDKILPLAGTKKATALKAEAAHFQRLTKGDLVQREGIPRPLPGGRAMPNFGRKRMVRYENNRVQKQIRVWWPDRTNRNRCVRRRA